MAPHASLQEELAAPCEEAPVHGLLAPDYRDDGSAEEPDCHGELDDLVQDYHDDQALG